MNTTTIQDVIAQVRVHADGTNSANDATVLADYVWMLKHGNVASGTERVWSRIVGELGDLNAVLRDLPPESGLPRQMVYVIGGMVAHCLNIAAAKGNDKASRERLLELAWKISCAWDAIVAGDIDDLIEHVELEGRARGILA